MGKKKTKKVKTIVLKSKTDRVIEVIRVIKKLIKAPVKISLPI